MKKIILAIFTLLCALTLSACGSRTYAHDGDFTAFKYETSKGAPQVTWVTVTIKNDKIEKFFIDCRQGNQLKENDEVVGGDWALKTKKELKEEYGMSAVTGNLEWYEQAALIEDYFLKNGTTLTVDDSNHITGITGVSIVDGGYSELAAQAVENAKAGIVTAFKCTSKSFTWATAKVDAKGNLSDFFLDCAQFGKYGAEGAFCFRDSKQTLKEAYGMAAVTGKLEWYQQADALCEAFEANGEAALAKGENGLFTVTGVSVKDDGYSDVLKAVVACVK